MSTKKRYSENEEKQNFVKETVEKLELKCANSEIKNEEIIILSEEEKKIVLLGLEDSKNGRVISSLESRKMAEECFK